MDQPRQRLRDGGFGLKRTEDQVYRFVGGERSNVQCFRTQNGEQRTLHFFERRIVDEILRIVHAEEHERHISDLA